ncbi:MAG: Crp/Fnr family transcriptional regulator [Nitrospinota bacterium]|nr:MAG: Crp/Fnr family transcriptional regulator [Nitrospinota bacterium]
MHLEELLWLKTVPLFNNLELPDLKQLASATQLRQYDKHHILFFQGDPCHGFFCLKSGAVKISRSTPDGKKVVLRIARPGESFAEVPVLDGGPYPATAETVKPSLLYFIQKQDFLALLDRYPALSRKLIANLTRRCRYLVSVIEDLTLKQAHSRLAKYLWEQAYQKSSNRVLITLTLNKGELASLLGTAPETFSRILRRFQEEGILSVQGKRVTIHDLQKLQAQI